MKELEPTVLSFVALRSLEGRRGVVVKFFRTSPRTQTTERSWERERRRKVEKDREKERERGGVHAGSRVYTRITQTVVGELTYCNYRGNYCRHISRIRCVASLCCSVARLEFSCPSTRQLAG